MIHELLHALLWQARLALRSGPARAHAAHGYVDEAYRPPRLPFVSVLGPLGLHPEPERDPGRVAHATVRVPGHVVGSPRAQAGVVPAGRALRLRLDGWAHVTLAGLPGGSFLQEGTGPALAQAVNAGLAAARAGGGVRDAAGAPVTDAAALAALAPAQCRWDAESRRFALASGPGLEARGGRSSVEVLPVEAPALDVAPALGLVPPERSVEGRWFLSRLPAPRPFTVDVRLDFWAGSQGQLAALVDALAAVTPTRGQLLLRPGLLARDVAPGDTTLRLLDAGEPTTARSLLHLEGTDQAAERARGRPVALSAGAAWLANVGELRLGGAGTARVTVHPTPLVPDALHASNPAPRGLGLSVGLTLEPGGSDGDSLQVLTLRDGAVPVLSVRLDLAGDGEDQVARVVASATFRQGAGSASARAQWDVPAARLERGATLHVRAESGSGTVHLALDGEGRPAAAEPQGAQVAAPGVLAAASDMELVLGNPGGNPAALRVRHLHLVAEPVGPLDPALRGSVAGAERLRVGDVVALAESRDGHRTSGRAFQAVVVGVDVGGGAVTLDKPVPGAWARGRTLVFQEECFLFQTGLRRRDDLLNHLYRVSVDYRVSALLDEVAPFDSAPLVERPDVTLGTPGAARPASGHPGVSATLTPTGTPDAAARAAP